MKKTLSLASCIGIFAVSLLVIPSSFASFTDSGGREDTKAIEYLQDRGVVEGYSVEGLDTGETKYKPEQNISRAEFVKIVLETAKISIVECSKSEVLKISNTFSDVVSSDWFAEYVCSAYKSGFVEGYSDGTFKPNEPISLVEAAKIVTLTQGTDLDLSNDGEWFEKYLEALTEEKALNTSLVSENSSPINRGVMADMIWRLETGNEVFETDEPQEIESCVQLEKQIEKSQKRSGNSYYGDEMLIRTTNMDGIDAISMESLEDAPSSSMSTTANKSISSDSNAGATNDFSQTNIQEQGVDEADIVKNDGSHIFYARGGDVKMIQAYPANSMSEDASIKVEDMNVTELFLQEDTLILLGNRTYSADIPYINRMAVESSMPYYTNGGIEVRIFDVSDRKNPIQTRSVSLDGSLVSSRRVGETLYLVGTNGMYNYQNGGVMPMLRDGEEKTSVAPQCGTISYFPNFTSPQLTTLAAINTSNPSQKISLQSFLGAGQNIYSSVENLYVVQNDNKQVFRDEDGVAKWGWEDISKISKFSLDGQNVEFVAQGEVDGRVLNQYSMSEFEGDFRIATTAGWSNNSENIVSILDENLKPLGKIRDIAKGEQIKSVRFMGERGFVVTFKSVDPLFVIDMDRNNPTILGELKIPGWSDYLHPIDENYLIGFGKEVNAESENNERLTWDMLMGMKISIFDVSDLSDPKEIHKTVIGDRGTESKILRNPKALFFDAERKLIGFPITIQIQKNKPASCSLNEDLTCSKGCSPACEPSVCDEESGICTSDCKITCVAENSSQYEEFETSFSGAHLYHFDRDNGFELQGAISHMPEYSENFWDRNYMVNRLVRIGDYMYSVAYGEIKGLDMQLQQEGEVSFLHELSCQEIQDQNLCTERTDCTENWIKPYCAYGKLCVAVVEFGGCMDK